MLTATNDIEKNAKLRTEIAEIRHPTKPSQHCEHFQDHLAFHFSYFLKPFFY